MLTNDGLKRALGVLVNQHAGADLVLFLFSSRINPKATTQLASLTEVVGGGYAAVTLLGSDWQITLDKGQAVAVHPAVTFTFTSVPGTPTVWGYGIRQGNVLIDAGLIIPEGDDGLVKPFIVTVAGDYIEIVPSLVWTTP